MPRTISDNGIQFTKTWEMFSPMPYFATAHEKSIGLYTWGYGHTGKNPPNGSITPGQALILLDQDMGASVKAVDALAHPSFNQAQFDAVVDLVFNTGPGVIASSTGTGQALRDGDVKTLRAKLALFINQNGKPVLGLRRRVAGRLALFDGKPWQEAEKIGRAVN